MKPFKLFLIVFFLFSFHFSLFTPVLAGCNPPDDYSSCMDQHPDINIRIRDWVSIDGRLELVPWEHKGEIDRRAPRLNTLIEGEARPSITSLRRVYKWDWDENERSEELEPKPVDLSPEFDFANLVGFETGGNAILVPDSGYALGKGIEILVLFATDSSVTLKYTCEDDMVWGYGIHLMNFQVDPELVAFYNQLDQAGRVSLPALDAGMRIGQGKGEILVSVRDTGSFMDPRWENDWWQGSQAAAGVESDLVDQLLEECGGAPIDFGPDDDALICSDFSLTGGTSPGGVTGELRLRKIDFPDFSLPLRAALGWLKAHTPEFFQNPANSRSLSIPDGVFDLKIKHRLEGQSEEERQDPSWLVSRTTTHEAYVPYLTANFAIGALQKPEAMGDSAFSLNFILPEVDLGVPPEGLACPDSEETASAAIPGPTNLNPRFTTTETGEIEVESRGYLPGGKILEKKSKALNEYLPYWVVFEEGESSKQEGRFSVSLPGVSRETTKEVKYSGMKAVYHRGCCLLHAVYPYEHPPENCPCE